MSKPKFASLTASLLARKGEAEPASASARSFSLVKSLARAPAPAEPSVARGIHKAEPVPALRRDCLEALPRAETPKAFKILAHGSEMQSQALPLQGSLALGLRKRTAVTVRLNETRYLRLKLTGARLHRTNQDLLTAALDSYLAGLGFDDIEAVAPAPKG